MFELDFAKLTKTLKTERMSIAAYMIAHEQTVGSQPSETEIRNKMKERLEVMRDSAARAREEPLQSISGMSGGNAHKYSRFCQTHGSLCGGVFSEAVAMALSCGEVNASMQRIVACPTAGACGIVPAVILSTAQAHGKDTDAQIDALFTAAGVGFIIASRATMAGAEGGCQAECGSAAAMGAAAVTEMLGGAPELAFHAAAIALKNMMGLVCDPVAGLVEIPCVKRNVSGAVNALAAADLALAGVPSYIPFDETVDAMYQVGKALSPALRETARGGLAATPTGERLKKEFLNA